MGRKRKHKSIDRLSALPDDILCSQILPRLSLKEAITSSLLSQRWKNLWTRLPSLELSRQFFNSVPRRRRVKPIIKKILQLHCGQLDSLELHFDERDFDIAIGNELKLCHYVSDILCYAPLRKINKILLKYIYFSGCLLPSCLFNCDSLRYLSLENFEIPSIPTDFGGFPSLKTCSLNAVTLCDGTLEQLLSGFPHLESLILSGCKGFTNLKICSSILSYVSIGFGIGLDPYEIEHDNIWPASSKIPDSMSLDCPQLISLKLETNPLVKQKYIQKNMPLEMGMEINAPKLEELSIESHWFQGTVNHKGAPGLTLSFDKLKKVRLLMSEFGEKDLNLLSSLLKNTPLLETMTLSLPPSLKNTGNVAYELLHLRGLSAEARIIII